MGERIARLLVERGMKDRELDLQIGARLGKRSPDGWTHKVTNGIIQQPRGPHLEAAAAVLGVDVRHLLTGSGPAIHRELPGWQEAARHPSLPYAPWVVEAVGDSPVMVAPDHVTSDFVGRACEYWLAVAPPALRERMALAAVAQRSKKTS